MSAEGFLDLCIAVTLVLLAVSFALCLFRIVVGPSLPDRILALDMLVILGIGFIATVGIMTEFYLYVDIAIALGLVGFLATVAFARFLLHRGEGDAPRQQSHG
jgi:multicomponent Na+:H+ antiporter subunit F